MGEDFWDIQQVTESRYSKEYNDFEILYKLYCMSNKSCPSSYSESLWENGQDFLDIQYG